MMAARLSPFAERITAAKHDGLRYGQPPHSETGLYSSEDGRRGCARHTAYPGGDLWRLEGWRAVQWSEYFEAFRTYPDIAAALMACEACGFTPRAVAQ